ncbi:glycosyltransferase [Rhodococcus sp. ARC_M6]|uniref:glycosyltransferase n=1 Tax=Rhodococcus sp. ARC_M6 TaxID=2928852 RepID=UPI001FB2D37C|nr:glycosyltransferase [Rhodococcus sp. ARC_M6]MCJ0902342.1 glycosyltransferase [Rhodococcus sp. ARC_M6]
MTYSPAIAPGRMLKISMVSVNADPLAPVGNSVAGRQNLHVDELSAALARAGHDVTVYTRKQSSGPSRVQTDSGYTVVYAEAGPQRVLTDKELLRHLGTFGGELRNMWMLDRPDVVHAHYWMSGIATELATRILGIPVLQTFHSLGVTERRHLGAADESPSERSHLEQLVARGATHVIATSSDEVFDLVRLGSPRSRTTIVPSGVDIDQFTPEGPRAKKTAEHRLLCVGRLVEQKGFDVAIAALASLPDAELVLAGGPPSSGLRADDVAIGLMKLAERLGVEDRVKLLGRVPHHALPKLMRSADAVLCTPRYEPFGIVALEAMACGIPVVATPVGGLRDTVVDGLTGHRVPIDNPIQTARVVRHLFDNAEEGASFSREGRSRACESYSWDHVAGEVVRTYGRCVTAPPRTRAHKVAHPSQAAR